MCQKDNLKTACLNLEMCCGLKDTTAKYDSCVYCVWNCLGRSKS